jgi:murein DD-endopeptidase MepM/ murein hydrolase activator NlpD
MGELIFEPPVKNPASHPYGEKRQKGPHQGIDYASPKGTPVKASERGMVVRAAINPQKVVKEMGKDGKMIEKVLGRYGRVVIIDHTPNADKDERHIYTLYAHLDVMNVRSGEEVKKGQVIGRSGNTGKREEYEYRKKKRKKEGGFHLHFEVIDAKAEKTWLKEEGPTGIRSGENRKDPNKYFNQTTMVEGTGDDFSDEEMEKLYDMIGTDFRTTPKPVLSIDVPKFKDFLRSIGRRSYQGTPPKVKLNFENNFGKEFRSLFPTLELEVNGKGLGRIRTGQKIYELDIWR